MTAIPVNGEPPLAGKHHSSEEARPVEQERIATSPRRPVMLRVPSELLARIDKAAKRLGLTRAAFVLSSTAERLERME